MGRREKYGFGSERVFENMLGNNALPVDGNGDRDQTGGINALRAP